VASSAASVPQIQDNVLSRRIVDEIVIVPVVASVGALNAFFYLNETGASVWEKIDGRRSVAEIVAALEDEYEGEPGEIGLRVTEFIDELAAAGLVGT
jgi:hypothetical protein